MATVIDFETMSEVNLQRCGAHRYISDPSFRVLCVACNDLSTGNKIIGVPLECNTPLVNGWNLDGWKIKRFNSLPEFFRMFSRPFIAHNATGFESVIYPDADYIDTEAIARQNGLPGSLDKAAKALGLGQKQENKKIFQLFQPKNKFIPVAAWIQLLRYCANDVDLTTQVYLSLPDIREKDIVNIDREINHRGVRVDRQRVKNLLDLYNTHANESLQGMREIELTESQVWSPAQILTWLEKHCKIDLGGSVSKSNVADFLADPDAYATSPDSNIQKAIKALEYRQDMVRVGPGKLTRLLDMIVGDRYKGSLAYHAAGPGRWAGRGVQPHNLPKPPDGFKGWEISKYSDLLAESASTGESVSSILNSLIRTVFVASDGEYLQIGDLSAIEARIVAWLSGETSMKFPPLGDPYIDMGNAVGGDRQLGKRIILGCGYQMGGERFAATAGVPLDFARHCVKGYRQKYTRIPEFWRALHEAGINAARGQDTVVGYVKFKRVGPHLHVVLPSGRPIVYRNIKLLNLMPRWARLRGVSVDPEPTVVYDNPRGYMSEMYGGKWCENICQGVASDVLREILRSDAGLYTVMHVHDSVITDGYSLNDLMDNAQAPIVWAPGLQIKFDAYESKYYKK